MTSKVDFGPWADRLANPHDVTRELADKVRESTDSFVPYRTGNLAGDSVEILDAGSAYSIVYGAPYAHYVFKGMAMAGSAPKHYTGEELNYFKGKHHENAGADWIERSADVNMSGWEEFTRGRLLS